MSGCLIIILLIVLINMFGGLKAIWLGILFLLILKALCK